MPDFSKIFWKKSTITQTMTSAIENSAINPQSSPMPQPQRDEEEVKSEKISELQQIITKSTKIEEISCAIVDYSRELVQKDKDQMFYQYFVQNKFLRTVMQKLRHFKYDSELLKAVFSSLEYLLKVLKKDQHLVFFIVSINRQKYISEKYIFHEEEDMAYYANFLKLLVRKINEDDRYLAIFINEREPHFPIMLNLLKFHDSKDAILHTSAKLSLMEICSNKNKLIQEYIVNFPFIIFYPLYVSHIANAFSNAYQKDLVPEVKENLQEHLRFLEDFIHQKDRPIIDMYTNTFMVLLGKLIYREFASFPQKNKQNLKRILTLINQILIPDISVLKIKIGLHHIFNATISQKLLQFLKSKSPYLRTQYSFFEECETQIVDHCRVIFYKNQKTSKSMFKTMNSFIPYSKDNWLFHEIKKIQQHIGFVIEEKETINFEKYDPNSFLFALSEEYSEGDHRKQNQIYKNIIKLKDEQILHLYLKIMISFKDFNKNNHFYIDQIIHEIYGAVSLSLIKTFYSFIMHSEYQIEKEEIVLLLFQQSSEKIIYNIMTEGWKSFFGRISKINLKESENKEFYMDIYRDIDCDILYYIALRSVLGTDNQKCQESHLDKNYLDDIVKEIKAPCKLTKETGEEIQMVLDGQYLKLLDWQQKIITKDPLLITNLEIYETTHEVEVIDKKNDHCFTLYFTGEHVLEYMVKSIFKRKEISNKIYLELKTMHFQMIQD